MKNKFKVFMLVLVMSISLIGCTNNTTKITDKSIKNISQVEIDELLRYKNSYVGNNSAIGNILSNLPANVYGSGFELKTDKKPYTIIANYKINEELDVVGYNEFWSNKDIDEFLEDNAIVLFSLIPNVDIVQFRVDKIGEELYEYTRSKLKAKYNKNLTNITNDEDSFKEFFDNK